LKIVGPIGSKGLKALTSDRSSGLAARIAFPLDNNPSSGYQPYTARAVYGGASYPAKSEPNRFASPTLTNNLPVNNLFTEAGYRGQYASAGGQYAHKWSPIRLCRGPRSHSPSERGGTGLRQQVRCRWYPSWPYYTLSPCRTFSREYSCDILSHLQQQTTPGIPKQGVFVLSELEIRTANLEG
jgi:hypothetical protein